MSANSHIKSYFAPFQPKSRPNVGNCQKWSGIKHCPKWLHCPLIVIFWPISAKKGIKMVRGEFPIPNTPLCEIFIHVFRGLTYKINGYPHIPDTQYIMNILHFYTLFRDRYLKYKRVLARNVHFSIFKSSLNPSLIYQNTCIYRYQS